MTSTGRTAVVVCRDDAHAFLLESVLTDSVDRVLRVPTTRAAIDLLVRGLRPVLVLVDVALFDTDADAAAVAARLRVLAGDAVVLEVSEHMEPSGDELADRLRGNSLEAHDWAELRGA